MAFATHVIAISCIMVLLLKHDGTGSTHDRFQFQGVISGLPGKSCECKKVVFVQIFTAQTLAREQGRGAAKNGDDSGAGDRSKQTMT